MATLPQIRGMLLEEALLNLLRVSGYRTVEQADPNDKTLLRGSAGLEVLGRGGKHQIDAIADLVLTLPFCYPQRLLVEAKCFSQTYPVGIPIVRNAVGVLKDVGEYWETQKQGVPPKPRYHYQYAVFSASDYTGDAEKYAFAQDIYLIPLANSTYIQPIITAIRSLTPETFGVKNSQAAINISMTRFREAVRAKIAERDFYGNRFSFYVEDNQIEGLSKLFAACTDVNQALLAMIDRRFPIFLVPERGLDVTELQNQYKVRIYEENKNWYLVAYDQNRQRDIRFSFDLPIQLFELYAEQGVLSSRSAFDIKTQYLSEIQALTSVNNRLQVVNFLLDQGWLEEIRSRFRSRNKKNW